MKVKTKELKIKHFHCIRISTDVNERFVRYLEVFTPRTITTESARYCGWHENVNLLISFNIKCLHGHRKILHKIRSNSNRSNCVTTW